MVNVPLIKLNNGTEIPAFGLGTYKSIGSDVEQAVKDAIDAGYRHIDTAFLYDNEAEVGNAVRQKIKENVVKREDMYIVTKLWSNFHHPDKVEYVCNKSLQNLNLDYIDLYLMHWPFAVKHVADDDYWPVDENDVVLVDDIDIVDTYKAMEELVKKGLVRSIGVSNFNSEQITRILDHCTIKPVMNQIECSPALNQKKLIAFCKVRDIHVTAFSPLGRPNTILKTPEFLFDDKIAAIATKYNKTAPQIVLRFLVQSGAIPIPKSVTRDRIRQNIDIFDFELADDDVNILNGYNTGHRIALIPKAKHAKYYPFNIEF